MEHEKKFISGFNNGYLLAEHEPQLLTILLKNSRQTNEYINGIFFGQKEYQFEKEKARLKQLENLRGKSRDKEDKERNL